MRSFWGGAWVRAARSDSAERVPAGVIETDEATKRACAASSIQENLSHPVGSALTSLLPKEGLPPPLHLGFCTAQTFRKLFPDLAAEWDKRPKDAGTAPPAQPQGQVIRPGHCDPVSLPARSLTVPSSVQGKG